MSFFSPPSPLPNPAAAEFSTPGREAKPKAFLEGHLADPLPASAVGSSRHHDSSYAKPKRERIPNACACHWKSSRGGPSQRIQWTRVRCANSCRSAGGRGSHTSSGWPILLRDLAVVARAVLWGALGRPDGFGSLQAVPFAAAAAPAAGQGIGAAVHHHRVHPVGHGEGFQVALDGDGQGQLVDEVHRGAGHDGSAAQVL